jgi:hypothetical protein
MVHKVLIIPQRPLCPNILTTAKITRGIVFAAARLLLTLPKSMKRIGYPFSQFFGSHTFAEFQTTFTN